MGLNPHVMTYNFLINAYAHGKRLSKFPQFLNEMDVVGLKLHDYTYSTLIYGFFWVNDFRKYFYYHKEMIKNNQVYDSMSYANIKVVLYLIHTLKSKRDRRDLLGQIRKQIAQVGTLQTSTIVWVQKYLYFTVIDN